MSRECRGQPLWGCQQRDLEPTSALSLSNKSTDLWEKQMASGERERRTGFASGFQKGPISSRQKLQRSRQVPSPPLPRTPPHGNPAAPSPDIEAQGSQALPELTGLMPGGESSSHAPEGWNPLMEPRKPFPSTIPPSLHLLLQGTADTSPDSQQRSKGHLWRWAHLGGSQLAQLGQTSGGCCWQERRHVGPHSHHGRKRLTSWTRG